MRTFSFSVRCGSGFAAAGLGAEPVEGRSSTFMSTLLSDGTAALVDRRAKTRALQHLDELRFETILGGVFDDRDITHAPVVADAQRGDHLSREFPCADVDLGCGRRSDDLGIAGSGLRQGNAGEGK